MADRSPALVLEALGRAAADPAGLPLLASKSAPGLFAATSAGKQAAQRSKDEGYLRIVRTETRGKASHEVCALTEKGLAYLLHEASPRQVLEDLVRALQTRQAQTGELLVAARQMQLGLDGLKLTVERVLRQLARPASSPASDANGSETGPAAVLSFLAHWQASGASEDCPLPELFSQVRQAVPQLSIGQFHDALRRLHEQERIYLHPWTGPLYDLPEPACALLVGHEVAYYVSLRT